MLYIIHVQDLVFLPDHYLKAIMAINYVTVFCALCIVRISLPIAKFGVCYSYTAFFLLFYRYNTAETLFNDKGTDG